MSVFNRLVIWIESVGNQSRMCTQSHCKGVWVLWT